MVGDVEDDRGKSMGLDGKGAAVACLGQAGMQELLDLTGNAR